MPFSFVFYHCFQQKLLPELLFYLNDGKTFGSELPPVITNHLHNFCEGRSFKLACDRKVEEIQVTSAYISVPPCIFDCETLDNLELNISNICIITMLIKSCPLLETLEMTLNYLLNSPRISIFAPNLKSLYFIMVNIKHQVIIDAPKLTYLCLVDRGLLINFVMGPTKLDIAYIDLTYLSFLRIRGIDANDFLREISKFVVQLSSVRNYTWKAM
ncbi:hypothetical protein RDABS01_020759 [Bienertia sinuspersici]